MPDADGDGDGGAPRCWNIPRVIPKNNPKTQIVFLEGEGVYMDANGEKFTTVQIQEWVDWKRKTENK